MFCQTIGVFSLVVVKLPFGDDLNGPDRTVVQNPHLHLLSLDIALYQRHVVIAKGLIQCRLQAVSVLDDRNAHRGALLHRLDHSRQAKQQAVGSDGLAAPHRQIRGDGQTGRGKGLFAVQLMHRQGAGQYPGAGIGNIHQLKQTLHTAILTVAPVQGDEGYFNPFPAQYPGQITSHVDGHAVIALLEQRPMDRIAAFQRHLSFRREPPHQHADPFFVHNSSPTILTSSSNRMPLCSSTACFTRADKLRKSAAVA